MRYEEIRNNEEIRAFLKKGNDKIMKNLLKFVFFITLCTLFTPLLTVGVVENMDAEGETQLTEPATLVSENHLLQTGQKSYDKSTTITLYTQGECRKINLQEYMISNVTRLYPPINMPKYHSFTILSPTL